MKRAAFWTGVFVAGGVLALVNSVTLWSLWISLGWRQPVADWLIGKGVPSMVAAYWGLVWIRLPDWVVFLLVGAVIGRLARSGKWLRYALFTGGGAITYSLACTVLYCFMLADYSSPSLAIGTFWRSMAWDLVAPLLLLLAAWLFSRTRGKPAANASTPATAES